MPRPRTAPTDLGHCRIHGPVTARQHSAGTYRDGRPRVSWRCLECHHARTLGGEVPSTLGFCNAGSTDGSTELACRRPHGHPPDLHVSSSGHMWPARVDHLETRF